MIESPLLIAQSLLGVLLIPLLIWLTVRLCKAEAANPNPAE